MTTKEYLGQAHRVDQRINAKLDQITSLRELSTKATSTITDMPHNPSATHKSMECIIAKIADLEQEINQDISTLVDLKGAIMTVIKSVANPEHQTLLELRYLCFKTWEQIAVDMGYSLQHVFRIHDKAAKEIAIPKNGE